MNSKVLIVFKLFAFIIVCLLSFWILFGLFEFLIIQKGNFKNLKIWNILNFSFVNNFQKGNKNFLTAITFIYLILNFVFAFFLFKENIKKLWKVLRRKQDHNSNWLLNEINKEKDYSLFKKHCSYGFNKSSSWVLKFEKNKKKWLNIQHEDIDKNSLIIGGTGSGKTQRILLPNILYNINLDEEYRPNLIINDPKREIITFTGKRLKEQGYKIYVIDFENTKKSLNWNPLLTVFQIVEEAQKKQNLDLLFESYKRLIALIDNLNWGLGGEANEFWNSSGKKFIEIVAKTFLLMKFYLNNFEAKDFNFTNIAQNITSNFNVKYQDLTLYKILEKHKNDNELWNSIYKDYISMVSNAEATLGSQLQNGLRSLDMFVKDEFIKNLTSYSERFNINDIFNNEKQKFVVFIHYADQNTANHKLVSLLIDELYQGAIDKAKRNLEEKGFEKLERRLLIILEEFGNLPQIPNLDNKLSINRSRNILFCLVLQDKNQLKKYNTNENREVDNIILSNLQFVYFLNSSDENTKKYFINKLGTKQVEKYSYSKNGKNTSENISYQEKPLISIQELSKKAVSNILVFIEGLPPLYIKTNLTYKYFSNDKFKFDDNENSLQFKHFDIDIWFKKESNNLTENLIQKEINKIMQLENLNEIEAKKRFEQIKNQKELRNDNKDFKVIRQNVFETTQISMREDVDDEEDDDIGEQKKDLNINEIEEYLNNGNFFKIKNILKKNNLNYEFQRISNLYKEYQNSEDDFKELAKEELKEFINDKVIKKYKKSKGGKM